MTLARAARLLLGFVALLIVVWSFFDVGYRALARGRMAQERPITLQILHWGNAAEAGVVQKLVERYEQDNPQVRIIRIHTPGGDVEMSNKLKTMLAAGTPPDLFYLPPGLLPEMAQMELIRPIDEYLEQERRSGTAGFLDDYFPIMIDAWKYDVDSQTVGRGKMYGLPKDFTTAGFWVNVDLFKAAGVDVPYGGWTWDQFEAACRRITSLSGTSGFEGRKIYGGFFQLWDATIRNILWTYGGEFFGRRPDGGVDFRNVTLDEPAALEALRMIVRTRINEGIVYNPTGIAQDGGQEFINGNIGCIGPIGRWMVPTYKSITSFNWDFVPIPYKSKEHQASQIYYTAWSMTAGTEHPDESYKLMKFLCGAEGAVMQSELGLAIPPLKSVAYSPAFLSPPGIPPHNAKLFLDAIEYARIPQVPSQAQWRRILEDRITKSLQLGKVTPLENVKEIEAAWLAELNSPLRQRRWPLVRWDLVLAVTAAIVATAVTMLWWRSTREQLGPLDRAQARAGWLFIMPWVLGFLALTLGPMIASLLLSFTSWSAMTTITEARAVGAANYRQLFAADPTFCQSLKVTFYFVALAVPVTQLAALGVALLMNLKLRGITLFRTIYFVPAVISGVVLAVLWLQIFNNDYGVLNEILRPIAHQFGAEPPDWFGRDAARWAIPAFVIMGLWGVGGGMIIYLAGLKGISASLYEAATIDGAGPIRRLWNVTLPMLSPLIFYNLVMGIIGSFQVFTQAYVMTGAGPDNATLFYVLNLFRQAFEFHNMGYASAMAWVLFLIVLAVTILIFRASKNLVYYEGLKT
ncbi:MAG TPA: extracellular solute-binding protein [Tepidisphaeraceae bacterium]|nr:extracellular solute-binding protein [Tepidisphaeraceae bacterium]